MKKPPTYKFSKSVVHIQQSGIRAAGLRCQEVGGINLGQGVCDIPTPEGVKKAAEEAINFDNNTYSIYEGVLPLREAIAKKLEEFNHIKADPEKEIMVSHGSTGSFVCAVSALFNPGDEVILFEPFYGYHRSILELNQVVIRTVDIDLKSLSFDLDQLERTITQKTKGIVICTPSNPSGKVFSEEELLDIGNLAEKFGLYIITDEIYEHITYPGFKHVSIASLKEFKDRTITISGFSKTYNVTGWRMGYACSSSPIIERMSLVHDILYVCPATPFQYAMITALSLGEDYFTELRKMYLRRRDFTLASLREMGFEVVVPQGSYYIMVDFSSLGIENDNLAVNMLLDKAKVATVPGRSFYINPDKGKHQLRICYALGDQKVLQGLQQIKDFLSSRNTSR